MTLLLGPPGSGKSTLLLALTGRLENSLRVMLSSDLHGIFKIVIELNRSSLSNRFQGRSPTTARAEGVHPQRTSVYVSQEDLAPRQDDGEIDPGLLSDVSWGRIG